IAPPLTPAPELAVLNPGGQLGRVGVARRLQILATEAGQPALTYSALGLPAGLRINAASGLISGTPARTERGSVTVTVTDGHGGAARTTFIWTIAGRPRVRASSIRLRRGGHIRLSVTILAGARAAGIKSVLVRLPAGVHLALTARDRRLGVSAVSASGAHLPNRPRLVHDALLVKLSRTTRAATVTLFSPQVLLSPRLRASLTGRRARTFRLTATPSDGAGITTRLSATATITTTLR
ncbi:MAG TPA: Ig domain-containing protein, partial [Solirubrobacteraceae bacterium]|nr:Ig domain-containing protein [Solirubrobacteraceae bacterium]